MRVVTCPGCETWLSFKLLAAHEQPLAKSLVEMYMARQGTLSTKTLRDTLNMLKHKTTVGSGRGMSARAVR